MIHISITCLQFDFTSMFGIIIHLNILQLHLLQKKLDVLKENMEEKDNRIEALAEKIRQLNQSHSKAEEQFNLELNAQAKLIELHKVRPKIFF